MSGEKLVSLGDLPPNQRFIEIEIPKGTSYEVVVEGQLPGWADDDQRVAKTHGSKWFNEVRTAILFVPSLAARMENNVLINPSHPDARHIKPGRERENDRPRPTRIRFGAIASLSRDKKAWR